MNKLGNKSVCCAHWLLRSDLCYVDVACRAVCRFFSPFCEIFCAVFVYHAALFGNAASYRYDCAFLLRHNAAYWICLTWIVSFRCVHVSGWFLSNIWLPKYIAMRCWWNFAGPGWLVIHGLRPVGGSPAENDRGSGKLRKLFVEFYFAASNECEHRIQKRCFDVAPFRYWSLLWIGYTLWAIKSSSVPFFVSSVTLPNLIVWRIQFDCCRIVPRKLSTAPPVGGVIDQRIWK